MSLSIKISDENIGTLGSSILPHIEIETNLFSGSLSMLLQCVKQKKVDLYEIPLLPLCEAYYLYLIQSDKEHFDSSSAAMMGIAYLIERKAAKLLPSLAEEDEPEEPLELPSPKIHEYEEIIESLKLLEEERSRYYFRKAIFQPQEYTPKVIYSEFQVIEIAQIFEKLLQKACPPILEQLSTPRRSLKVQMEIVLDSLTSHWKPLEALVQAPFNREEALWWFLSLLELIRLGQATFCIQKDQALFAKAY